MKPLYELDLVAGDLVLWNNVIHLFLKKEEGAYPDCEVYYMLDPDVGLIETLGWSFKGKVVSRFEECYG